MSSDTVTIQPHTCPVCLAATQQITVKIGGAVDTRHACNRCGYRLQRDYGEQR